MPFVGYRSLFHPLGSPDLSILDLETERDCTGSFEIQHVECDLIANWYLLLIRSSCWVLSDISGLWFEREGILVSVLIVVNSLIIVESSVIYNINLI